MLLVGSSVLLHQIDDARSNKNQVSTSYTSRYVIACSGPCGLWLSRQATDLTLGQRKYLPSRRTNWFTTSAILELKLAVRANSGTLRSSCICLLLLYYGASVSRRRHLDLHVCMHTVLLVYWHAPVAYRGGVWGVQTPHPPPPEIPKISVDSLIAWARNGISISFCSSLCFHTV